MAKALARPPARRSRTPERERERELKRLCLSVCDDTGFRLYAATYDQPRRRDQLIAQLKARAKTQKVRITRLDIADAGPETSLVGLLRAHLEGADLPAGWRQAVMVVGIEQRLDYSSGREGVAFLHQANLLRDALPEGGAGAGRALAVAAGERGHADGSARPLGLARRQLRLHRRSGAADRSCLREMTTLRPEDDLRLSGEQRQARLRMLEDLLAELERAGPAKSKRQVAERADLLLELGTEEWRLGRAAEAIPRFERALSLYREIGDRRGEGSALGRLGSAYADLGEPRQAIEHYEQHLAIAHEIGDRQGEGTALGNLGIVLVLGQPGRVIGELRRAIEFYEQTLVILARESATGGARAPRSAI